MTTLSSYTGGNSGWGTMISKCATCGEIVAEYYCDEDGRPTEPIFDNTEKHVCELEEE
jgi:hypothetical protein